MTFYSFKGGTGRTMAVANVAWILAANGHRVLAVDWDLESPGLHHYFRPFLADKKLRHSRGVIDMIRDFAAAVVDPAADPGEPDWYQRYADVEREAVSLTWSFPGHGLIDLLPAGQQNAAYSGTVSTFDWAAFYERLGGEEFLRALRVNMSQGYDYVLIDSRTGLSDSAGMCTVNLPDTVVNCFTLNEQSIDGAAAVAESIVRLSSRRPVRILPVPMRVEDAELFKLETGRDHARQRFEPFLRLDPDAAAAYWGDVEIPYKPFFAYEEILATFGERARQEHSLLSSFERLTGIITENAVTELPPMDERERRRWLSTFERQKPSINPRTMISYASIDRTWADWIAGELEQIGQSVTLQEIELAAISSEPGTDPMPADGPAARLVVLISHDYLRSPQAAWLWDQVAERESAGGNLLRIRIDNSRLSAPFTEPHRARELELFGLSEEQARPALLSAFDQPHLEPPTGVDRQAQRSASRFPANIPPVWNTPQRNPTFTGRTRLLEELRDRLLISVTATSPQALHGLGGAGKTQIALEYVHRFAANYDIVWWIPAEQPSLVRAALSELAEALDLPTGPSTAETVDGVLDALRRGEPYRRWLLVFDNADQPEEIRQYLPAGAGHILLTTRNLAWGRYVTATEVPVFTRVESVSLIRRLVPAISEPDAEMIAGKLGDLPLVIEQAAAWLAATGMPASAYSELLDTELPRMLRENPPPGYEQTPAGTWRLSLERIRADLPAAARLLEVCAFFAPEPIPMRLLYSSTFIALLQRLDPSLQDPLLIGRLVQEIGRYALARSDTGQGTIEMHRLVQTVVRSEMTPEDRESTERSVHDVLAAANPKEPDEPKTWPDYRLIRRHLEPTGVLNSPVPAVRQLVIDMVRYLWRIGDWQDSQELGERALIAWRRGGGPDDTTTLWLRLHMANAIRSQARYAETYEIDNEVHELLLGSVGQEHPYVVMSISGLAADLKGLGRYQESLALDDQALSLAIRVLGAEAPRTIFAMSNKALSLRFIGDFRQATELDETAYQLSSKIGLHRPYALRVGASLGRDYRDLGRFTDAQRLLRQVMLRSTDVNGPAHELTLIIARILAVTLRKLGELSKSHDLTRDIKPKLERRLGRNHPEALACLNDLANIQSALGDDRAAQATAESALRQYDARFGPDHPSTLACRNNVAIFTRKLGNHEHARAISEEVIDRFRIMLGPDHPYTLACLVNRGNELFDGGDLPGARANDRDVYERLASSLGPKHPDTLAAMSNLAITLAALDEQVEARRLRQDAHNLFRETLGPDHPNTGAPIEERRLNCDIDPPSL
ncbi:FxSxx-COOH system tetratricopeptide repeat protein [Actinoplanes awajinensis]|uniref:FxSxx-COOH system tetratricopeptide repeat protein n=1 Tax=Actinoplanes awajinensis TaxID=135946 RepID=UPI0018DB57BA|nr:FxSxx-COOH system tetratricopeptide repeat protein [Actinoplanes awajinensis]